MNRGIFLHPHAGARRGTKRFEPTWSYLEAMEPRLDELGYDLVHAKLSGDYGYGELMARYWTGSGPLVILEHDLVPQFAAKRGSLEAFLGCGERWCAVDYPLWLRQHSRAVWLLLDDGTQAFVCVEHDKGPFTSFRHEIAPGANAYWWGRLGERWADLSCLGLTRFSEELRRSFPFTVEHTKWNVLDSILSMALHKAGNRTHIHYPRALHHHPVPSREHRFSMPDGTWYKMLHLRDLPPTWRELLGSNDRNGPKPGPITLAANWTSP